MRLLIFGDHFFADGLRTLTQSLLRLAAIFRLDNEAGVERPDISLKAGARLMPNAF